MPDDIDPKIYCKNSSLLQSYNCRHLYNPILVAQKLVVIKTTYNIKITGMKHNASPYITFNVLHNI